MFMELWECRFHRRVNKTCRGSQPLSSSNSTPLLLLPLGCTILFLFLFVSLLIYFPYLLCFFQKLLSFSSYPINAPSFILFKKIVYAYKSPLPLIITLFSNCIILFFNLLTSCILFVKYLF